MCIINKECTPISKLKGNMQPLIVYDPNVDVNLKLYYTSEESEDVQIISKGECFIFSESMVKKNVANNKLRLINLDNFGLMNASFVMNTYKNYK